jgi:SSS family transporter
MFATSPLVSARGLPFPFRRMFPFLLRRVVLLCCLPLAAHAANNLVSLQTTEVTKAQAIEITKAMVEPTFNLGVNDLAEVDPTLRAVAAAEQENALFVVARNSAGKTVLLRRRDKGGWEHRTPPPFLILTDAQAISQAHIFFVSPDPSGGQLRLVAYHTITDTWAVFGSWPLVGTAESAEPSPNGFIVTTRDTAGHQHYTQVELVSTKRGLKVIDYVVIVAYLFVVAGIGLYFYLTGKKDPANFFVAGRKIPWWAAGLSLYATGTSAISYLAIPAKSYATNWLYLGQNVVGFAGSIYVGFVIAPLIRRLNLISVYQYLEMRFHPAVRTLASLICIVQHLAGRMSIVLLLPALALSAVTGISVVTCILLMGVITTIYTVLGGMKAVIWTDVLQVFVMVGGALFAIGWMIHGTGGLGAVVHTALADHKIHLFDFSFDFTIPNVWTFVLILIVGTLTWPQDQVNTQRVLATKDDKAARNSLFMLTAIVLPGSFMFFTLGTLLYTYYKAHPAGLNPLLTTDQIFPQFIASDLPSGVTGLIIAGIFAASMATLSSNINSIATLVSVDFYERYAKNPSPAKSVRLAEWATVLTGIAGTSLALYLSTLDIRSLWDKFYELMALLGGGFSGIYALGMFTRRANWQGAVIGIVASIVLTLLTKLYTPLHVLMYGVVSIAACMLFGYLGSLFFPAPTQPLRGLTVFDQVKGGLKFDPGKVRAH